MIKSNYPFTIIINDDGSVSLMQTFIKNPTAKNMRDRYGKRFLYLSSVEELLKLGSTCESAYQKFVKEKDIASSGL